jgi:hypothetical protein
VTSPCFTARMTVARSAGGRPANADSVDIEVTPMIAPNVVADRRPTTNAASSDHLSKPLSTPMTEPASSPDSRPDPHGVLTSR